MKFALTASLLFLLSISKAQHITARVSEPAKKIFPNGKIVRSGHFLVGFDGSNYFPPGSGGIEQRKPGKFDVIIYDTAMRVLKSIPVTGALNSQGLLVKDVWEVNNVPFIIYHEVTAKENVGNVMALPVDPVTQTLLNPVIIGDIINSSHKINISAVAVRNIRYSLIGSANGKRHLFFLKLSDSDFLISVLDENMNLLWRRSDVFDSKEKAVIRSACIDNDGNVYLTFITDKKDDRRNGTHVKLAIINKSAREDKILDMGDAGWMAPRLLTSVTDPNIIHITGAYLNENGETTAGLMKAEFSIDRKTVSKPKRLPFPDSTIRQLDEAGWIKDSKSRSKYGVSNRFDAAYYEQPGGNIVAVSEMRFAKRIKEQLYHLIGPVVFASFAGQNGHFNIIPRGSANASILEGAYCSPYLLNDKTVIFYNDSVDDPGQGSASGKSENKYKAPSLIAAIISQDGTLIRETITVPGNYLSLPTRSIRLGAGKWIIPFAQVNDSGGVGDLQRWVEVTVR